MSIDSTKLILSLLLIVISCLIIWQSSHGFEIASDFLGRKMPLGIKGATINAIASSMPEFLTTLFFLFYLRDSEGFSGGLGVTSGSALFNLLLIPALAVLVLFTRRKPVKVVLNKGVLLREGVVLVLSQVVFIIILLRNRLSETEGIIMVSIYLVYILLLFFIASKRRLADPGYRVPDSAPGRSALDAILRLDLPSLVLKGNTITPFRGWILLIASTVVMAAGTWLLVFSTDLFGHATNIPLIFVAVVLSAAATSIPDTVISIRDARKGNYDDAVSNALGSNIFDIAFALGFPILLYNLFFIDNIVLEPTDQQFTIEMWVFLLLATIVALTVMLAGKHFTRFKAFLLLFIYLLFLLFVGSQVYVHSFPMGEKIGRFLTTIAEYLGSVVNAGSP